MWGRNKVKKKKTKSASSIGIEIPDEPTRKKIGIGDTTMVLFGRPKIGKSALAAMFPDVVFLATEPGQKFLRARVLRVDGEPLIKSWEQFKLALRALEKAKDVRTIAVDTIDALYQMCFDYVCESLNIDHPGDLGHGKAWNRLKLEWNEHITKLVQLGKGVIFISHANERAYVTHTEETTKTSPSIPKTGYEAVSAVSDYIFFYDYTVVKIKTPDGRKKRKSVRALYCQPTEDIEAGDRTGLFPPHIRMPAGEDAFKALSDTFDSVWSQMKTLIKK
jgi:hypothetical protein